MIKSTGMTLVAGLMISGCTMLGPEYEAPTTEIPTRFVDGGNVALVQAAQLQWWHQLEDARLNSLVQRGLAQNLNLETSYERIRAAQAALGRTGLNAQASGDVTGQLRRQETEANGATSNNAATLNANYVFDIFGGFRRGREQAVANFEAAQFDTGTVRLAYLADIVNAYVQARYFQAATRITHRTVESRRRTLSLVNQRRSAGEATELEVQQARAQLSNAKAALPSLRANFEGNVFRIATLLAEPAGPIMAMMDDGAGQPIPHRFGEVGIPADLVRNRPDVRFAERNFAAATAAVGVAEAQLYPSLSLSGAVTEGTLDSWNFGPTLSLPLLNRGFLKANRNIAISEARQAQLNWRSSVLTAIEDVQSSLSSATNLRVQLNARRDASNASGRVLRLSRESYTRGAITLIDVLDAERSNATNELAVAEACRDYALSWAQLQVAAGKGWYQQGADGPVQFASAKDQSR
ncbi:MAG: efflux transporter outer membrane subunit [Pseudomonadota bacterium]